MTKMTQTWKRLATRNAALCATVGLLSLSSMFATLRAPEDASSSKAVVEAGVASSGSSASGAAVANSNASDAAGVRWDLPNISDARVDKWVERFTTDLRGLYTRYLTNMPVYDDMIQEKLAKRDMPQDLIYLAMIESGFNPKIVSPAKAAGLWQFVSETGQRYGLTVKGKVDERKDPEKATDAALAYLSDLHDRFGSWYLAAAAYNTGENRVARIMREETGHEHGTDADYYRISSRLPRETRDYVPMMIAAARIAKEPAKYGFGDVAEAAGLGAGATQMRVGEG
jgi:membrane-bound lytic murein transglycosylase D